MSTIAKPLTKERREEMLGWDCIECGMAEAIEEVLAAEAYWREAVKTADALMQYGCGEKVKCAFCGDSGWDPEHKPDCPWRLAQE